MRFDKTIVILEPGFPGQDSFGGEIPSEPIRYNRKAQRYYGKTGEQTIGSVQSEVAEVQLTVRQVGLKRIDSTWYVEMDGVEYDIVGITEPPQVLGRNMYWTLHCVARK